MWPALGCQNHPMAFRRDPDGNQFFALRTYRANGTAVTTPVWLADSGGHWYCYTPGRSWKVRRIRANEQVQVARSDFHGEPYGPFTPGTARVLPRTRLGEVRRVLARKYGLKFRLLTVFMLLARSRKAMGPAVGLQITLETDLKS